jgi:signal transduction histidine kinase
MKKPAIRASSPRTVFVAVALGLTLVLAAVLALMAQASAIYHRSTAEGVLRDYAAFAAEQYVNRAQQRLATGAFPVLNLLRESGAGRAGGPLSVVLPSAGYPQAQSLLRSTESFFRLSLDVGDVASNPAPLGPEITRWIADSVGAQARRVYRRDWYLALVWGGGAERRLVAVYTVARDSGGIPRVAFGFLVSSDTLARVFRQLAESAPLLPASLTGGVLLDSLGAVRVLAPDSQEVFASGHYQSPFANTRAFDPMFGGPFAEITLRPAVARQLIIGGLPQSRLPLVLGLLGLTGVLVTTAIVQLRREQELARLRGDFVASVSHELRTPLAQIRMFTETLLLGRVRSDQERHRSLEILDQEARRLSHLVDNLLHVARGERNHLQLHTEDTDLSLLVRQVIEGFAPLAASRRMMVSVDIAEAVPARIDPGAARQILLNLLDNAVKYAPAGSSISVALEVAPGAVRILVEDRGPGVPAGSRDRIWERFARLDRDIKSSVAGSGIGLAIVRELVVAQGGRCWVEDGDSGGARFVVELPR